MRMRGHTAAIRLLVRTTALSVVLGAMLATPSAAQAQVELTGVIGGMLGGDLNNLIEGTSSLKSTFDNGPLYGARLGWIGGWIGAEGSFVTSPTGVKLEVPGSNVDLDAKVYYAEFNALLIPIPGPISPFFTIGAGWHTYKFDLGVVNTPLGDELTIEKGGWNWGGGLKINIKGLTLRGEVKDHLTKIGPSDFRIADIADELGITNETTLHNVEISGGVGIRF
jgi:opacity protein-like surface antigen